MSRALSHLSELQPELFAEISPELAELTGISPNDWLTIITPRALISARALITARMSVLEIEGRRIHQVGLPYHWGWKGLVTGDVANDLLALSQEPNVRIMETKGLVCNLIPGRHPAGHAALDELHELLEEQP
jgi:formate dehydrogenase major subunit